MFDDYVIISNTQGDMAIVYSFTEDEIGGILGFLFDSVNGWSYSTRILETIDIPINVSSQATKIRAMMWSDMNRMLPISPEMTVRRNGNGWE